MEENLGDEFWINSSFNQFGGGGGGGVYFVLPHFTADMILNLNMCPDNLL